MSDRPTPLTDAEAQRIGSWEDGKWDTTVVPTDFARTLERELAAANAALRDVEDVFGFSTDWGARHAWGARHSEALRRAVLAASPKGP